MQHLIVKYLCMYRWRFSDALWRIKSWSFWACDTCMRKTENELRRLQIAGFYRDVEIGEPQSSLDEVEKRLQRS